MMNPGVIPSDDAIQEVITFMVAPLQQTTAHVLAVVPMPFCQMFVHPPCGTQECHALKNRPYPQWCQAVMQFLLVLHSLLLPWIMALPPFCFLSEADVYNCHTHLESITFTRLFLNTSVQSYKLQHGNALSPYWAYKIVWISAPLTPSAHKSLRHLSALFQCKLKDTPTRSLLHS